MHSYTTVRPGYLHALLSGTLPACQVLLPGSILLYRKRLLIDYPPVYVACSLPSSLFSNTTICSWTIRGPWCSVPAFDWVRNLQKKIDPVVQEEVNNDISAAFALFWNLCRFWLPSTIIANVDNFMQESNIYLMAANSAGKSYGNLDGKYIVTVDNTEFEFTDVRLVPLAGVVSQNYAR
jgi:hypothetical protein